MKVENELAGLKGTAGSARLFARAQELIASGVNSTARAPRSGWSPYPLFVESGKGSRIVDVDGNEFIDYLLGLGPMLLGHRPERVTKAVVDFIQQRGTVFALPVADEIELARKIIDAVPSVEQMHLANSGTEAVLYALRLARAYTRRKKIIRFEGMYHGFSDSVYWSKHPPLEQAGPASQPVPVPQGPGMPDGLENSLIILPWNDGELLERTIRERGEEIAAVLTEPIMCNTGCILPEPGYLELMRSLTRELGIVLIFDEVITGFRVALGGAQQYYGVTPDLTVMAKGFGGGFPVAAVGGKKEIMQLVADGTVSMAGTYSGNGIAVSAANATLDFLRTPGIYESSVRAQRTADARNSRSHERGRTADQGSRDRAAVSGVVHRFADPQLPRRRSSRAEGSVPHLVGRDDEARRALSPGCIRKSVCVLCPHRHRCGTHVAGGGRRIA